MNLENRVRRRPVSPPPPPPAAWQEDKEEEREGEGKRVQSTDVNAMSRGRWYPEGLVGANVGSKCPRHCWSGRGGARPKHDDEGRRRVRVGARCWTGTWRLRE